MTDPFGHLWYVATHIEDVPADELEGRAKVAGRAGLRPVGRFRSLHSIPKAEAAGAVVYARSQGGRARRAVTAFALD